jgi:general secretion pathway protein G
MKGKVRGEKKRAREKGFTLIELMVTTAIIGVLAGIAIPAYSSYKDKGLTAHAKSDLKNIQLAIEVLAGDTETWPGPSDVGITADTEVWDLNAGNAGLVTNGGGFSGWEGPYLQSIPKDPWGNNYFFDPDYELNGQTVAVIGSFGPNGVGPNVYDSDDIVLVLPAG